MNVLSPWGKGRKMSAENQRPFVDTQHLSDVDTYVYETVATLEFGGGAVTREKILAVTDLDDGTVSEALRRLTDSRILVLAANDDGPRYELGRRDWSVTPEIPERQSGGRLWPQH
jgi:hypothetical protein